MKGSTMTMTCPLCRTPVSEPGACKTCLPYNIFAIDWLQINVGLEPLRQLMLSKLETLQEIDFEQATLPLEGNARDKKIAFVSAEMPDGLNVIMIPCLDPAGYHTVMFTVAPQHSVKDGMHRVRDFLGR